jgi:hypothetical protein
MRTRDNIFSELAANLRLRRNLESALRNALTLIKSLSTPPNSLPWESSTQPHLPTLVDKISTIAKEVL